MTVNKIKEQTSLIYEVKGRLDTNTAPQLEAELQDIPDDITELVFDFAGLEYISSAGLRILLSTHKSMKKRGRAVVRNTNDNLMGVFEVTGFTDVLNFE